MDHVTLWLVALAGKTAAFSCSVPLSVVIVVAPASPVTVIEETGVIWLEMVMTSVPKIPDPSQEIVV